MTAFEITIIVLLAAIVLFLLAIVCQFGVFLSRGDGTVWIGSKLSSINSKAQSIADEVGQTNAIINGFIPVFKKLLEHNECIENFWAADSSLVIKLLKEIENDMNEHGIAQAKWFDPMSNKSNKLTTIANHTNETTNKVAELVDFEKRNEQRNDEMFARCEEITKLQLAELKLKTNAHHTDDVEPFPHI